jgi:hypothetical protein
MQFYGIYLSSGSWTRLPLEIPQQQCPRQGSSDNWATRTDNVVKQLLGLDVLKQVLAVLGGIVSKDHGPLLALTYSTVALFKVANPIQLTLINRIATAVTVELTV